MFLHPKTWILELPQQLFTGRLQALGVGVGWLIGWLHSIERYLVRVGVGKPLLPIALVGCPLSIRHAGIPLEILIAPWGSSAYSYRSRLPAHMSLVRSTEYEPPGASRNIESSEYEHPRMSLQGSFGMETWGAPKFTAIPSQASTPHVQNGALRVHSAMGGIDFPKKEQTQPCTTHSVQVSFLRMFSWGPDSITHVFQKQLIFWGWVHDYIIIFFSLLAPPRWKDFIHVFFSIFQFLMYCKHVGSV